MRFHKISAAGALAASALLSACAGDPPVPNEEAVLLAVEQAMGQSPTEMVMESARQTYQTFQIVKGIGGEAAQSWDEARYNAELEAGFAPLTTQIDAAFAEHIGGAMQEGEGQALLNILAQGRNGEYALCVFTNEASEAPSRSEIGERIERCNDQVGGVPDDTVLEALGQFQRYVNAAMQNDERIGIAYGYVTCGVLADFGEEVSRENLTVDLRTTALGLGGNNRPCEEYDALAAERLTGEITPNFPAAQQAASE